MKLSVAELLGWRFPGLRHLAQGPSPKWLPCSHCGHPVSRALDPRGNVLGVDLDGDKVYVHACRGDRPQDDAPRPDFAPDSLLAAVSELSR